MATDTISLIASVIEQFTVQRDIFKDYIKELDEQLKLSPENSQVLMKKQSIGKSIVEMSTCLDNLEADVIQLYKEDDPAVVHIRTDIATAKKWLADLSVGLV